MKKNSINQDKSRLPPGQHLTDKFPVLQKGTVVHIAHESYTLKIEGEVENLKTYTLEELKRLKDKEIVADIHCVTSWSKFDTKWSGVSIQKLINIVKPKSTTNLMEFL